jgi:hypothetical protein
MVKRVTDALARLGGRSTSLADTSLTHLKGEGLGCMPGWVVLSVSKAPPTHTALGHAVCCAEDARGESGDCRD